jgi:molybdate transport system permease protein
MTPIVDWQALWLTVKLATIVSCILLVCGLPIAYWLAYSLVRWKFLVESVVAMPLVLPPTVLGFYALLAMGTRSPVGRWYESWSGHTLIFSFPGLVIASVLYSLPFAVQPFASSFAQIDRRLMDASALLGASRRQTFLRVIAPLAKGGIVRGVVLSFAHTVGEFGVVLMVGGNIPGITRTVSLDIYDKVQNLEYASANRTALVLLIFSFAVLAGIYGSNRNLWRGLMARSS